MSARLSVAAALLTPLWRWRRMRWLGGPFAACPASAGQRILMYHAIGTPIADDTQGRYTLTLRAFTAQMERLAALGARVTRPGVLPDGVAITFDDGYRDNLTHAYPVLKRLGLPFTIFVTPGFVRSGDDSYLTGAQLHRLAEDPLISIGAHGDSHARLTGLSDQALRQELVSSKAWLEQVTGKPVTTMSYPHGAVDMRVREAVRAAGFAAACSSEFGINPSAQDPFLLRRTDIWSSDSLDTFNAKLAGDWDWMRFFTRVGL